jgi:hypothetical protein
MDKKTIGNILGVSYTTMRKWDKETGVENFRKMIKKEYVQNDLDKLKKQNTFIQDQMFAQLVDRFRDPDPESDLDDEATIEERERYLKRFADSAEFKDIMKFWKDVNKHKRLDSPDGVTERVGEGVDPDKVRKRRAKVERKRKKYMDRKKRFNKVDEENDGEEAQEVEAEDSEGNKVEAQLVNDQEDGEVIEEEENITIEEYEIT